MRLSCDDMPLKQVSDMPKELRFAFLALFFAEQLICDYCTCPKGLGGAGRVDVTLGGEGSLASPTQQFHSKPSARNEPKVLALWAVQVHLTRLLFLPIFDEAPPFKPSTRLQRASILVTFSLCHQYQRTIVRTHTHTYEHPSKRKWRRLRYWYR